LTINIQDIIGVQYLSDVHVTNNTLLNTTYREEFNYLGDRCSVLDNTVSVLVSTTGNQIAPIHFDTCKNTDIRGNKFHVETATNTHDGGVIFREMNGCRIEGNTFDVPLGMNALLFGYADGILADTYFKNCIFNDNKITMGAHTGSMIFLSGDASSNNYGSRNTWYAPGTAALTAINPRHTAGQPDLVNNDILVASFDTTLGTWKKPTVDVWTTFGAISTWYSITGTDVKTVMYRKPWDSTISYLRFTLTKLNSGGENFPGNSVVGTPGVGTGQAFASFNCYWSSAYNEFGVGGMAMINFGTRIYPDTAPLLTLLGTGNPYVDYSQGTDYPSVTQCAPRLTSAAVDADGNRYFDLLFPLGGIKKLRIEVDIDPRHFDCYTVTAG
jgi:hypothetical protein